MDLISSAPFPLLLPPPLTYPPLLLLLLRPPENARNDLSSSPEKWAVDGCGSRLPVARPPPPPPPPIPRGKKRSFPPPLSLRYAGHAIKRNGNEIAQLSFSSSPGGGPTGRREKEGGTDERNGEAPFPSPPFFVRPLFSSFHFLSPSLPLSPVLPRPLLEIAKKRGGVSPPCPVVISVPCPLPPAILPLPLCPN